DLGGGTLDGKTGTITIEATVGETINLPGAPTRDGYTFKCWRGSEYAAGAEYEVEGDHAFAAEWEQNAQPQPKPTPVPKTADPFAGMAVACMALGTMGASAIVASIVAKRKEQ
ncbi:MAG: InlB B-repeat-containing protein, partial [Atopobiaceae bacterium]|nr:InlB B-repeat-containing protein [Atopobiaceae bacterium]